MKAFSTSAKGTPVLIDSRDFMYTIDRVNKYNKTTSWRCRLKNSLRCNARLSTADKKIIKFINEHNHDVEAQLQRLTEFERKSLK